jgi:hemerythrin-like domain-containing protein
VTELGDRLTHQHRGLDLLLGRFLSAAHGGTAEAAREAMAAFDEELRRHMTLEEESLIPEAGSRKLVPRQEESDRERLGRELRLEHVQIRELSGMMRRVLEQGDVEAARRLFPSLARRWDAHTEKEERSILSPSPLDATPPRP